MSNTTIATDAATAPAADGSDNSLLFGLISMIVLQIIALIVSITSKIQRSSCCGGTVEFKDDSPEGGRRRTGSENDDTGSNALNISVTSKEPVK